MKFLSHCKFISGTQVLDYIAISYVWGINPVWNDWCGRLVTEKLLKPLPYVKVSFEIHNSPALDGAACIPKDEKNLPAKMEELAKMADIYWRATMVLCLVPEVSVDTCITVARCNALMDDESYFELQKAIDIYGSFMFATLGERSSLRDVFASRWWEREWTFQEESIPIQRVLRVAYPFHLRAASRGSKPTLGKSASFWDSVCKITGVVKWESAPQSAARNGENACNKGP